MEQIIDRLEKSPIFAMSLSSKELFHSNFWAWLIETDHSFAKVFFDDIDADSIQKVTREKGNRDLTICLKDGSDYVIENKLKSIPYTEQLKDYQSKLPSFKKGLLTGIIPCQLPEGWDFRDYREIGKKIAAIAEKEPDGYRKELIKEYAAVIIDIYDLLEESTKAPIFIGNKLTNRRIEDLRFDDIVKKLQAESFKKYLTERFADHKNLIITSDFSNKNAMVNVFYVGIKYNIGITIQGNQFRRVISGSGTVEDIYQFGLEKGYFEKRNGATIFEKNTTMKKEHCKFEGTIGKKNDTKNTHVYQHWNIDDMAFESLADQIAVQLQAAAKLI